MSYKTYTTEALVCGSRINNTSDKAFLLFTREAGMLWASARSVREERSKQRFALQDFALVRVSLVKGKSGWRVGSVEGTHNYFTKSGVQPARAAVTSVVRLLRQFLHGEVAYPDVFDDTKVALNITSQLTDPRDTRIYDIFSLRLLYHLGYIADSPEFSDYLTDTKWTDQPVLPSKAISAIEKAKQVSHL